MDNNRLTKRIFLWDLHKCKNNWSKDVKSIFKAINCTAAFDSQSLVGFTSSNFIVSIRAKLMNIYKDKWLNDVSSQSKLSNYKLLKENFECENYVKMNLNKHVRSVIAQFRAGSLPIEIELGRYQRIPRENRICKQCQSNCVESELHFLFHCDKHSLLRSYLIQNLNALCSVNSTEIEKLKYLLKHDQLISKT